MHFLMSFTKLLLQITHLLCLDSKIPLVDYTKRTSKRMMPLLQICWPDFMPNSIQNLQTMRPFPISYVTITWPPTSAPKLYALFNVGQQECNKNCTCQCNNNSTTYILQFKHKQTFYKNISCNKEVPGKLNLVQTANLSAAVFIIHLVVEKKESWKQGKISI